MGMGTVQLMRKKAVCVMGQGPPILSEVPWSRRSLPLTLSLTTPCPPLILPFAQQLWSQLLHLPNARMALSVLPPGVNAARVDHIVVSWRNGMLPRRLLSSNNPVTARALAGDVLAGAGVATLFLFEQRAVQDLKTTSKTRQHRLWAWLPCV